MNPEIGRQALPPFDRPMRGLRSDYQERLDRVDDELVGGGLIVAEAMPHITRSFLLGDRSCLDEASGHADDIRDRCRRIEEQGFLLLALEAPVSGDLRRLVAILRLVNDVDRAGRLMRHVAGSVERLDPRLLPAELRQQLEELATRSIEVFRSGLDAWRRRDGLAIYELDRLDNDVDTLRTGLLVHARELDGAANEVLVLGLLGRYFERLADHGVAFAQHVTFVVTGERVEIGP